MSLYVARRAPRVGLYLQEQGLMFFLPESRKSQLSQSELDEIVRAALEKQGITSEVEVQEILDKAETDYEARIKIAEAEKEVRRLMKLRAEGKSLMQVGHKKWKEVYYAKR